MHLACSLCLRLSPDWQTGRQAGEPSHYRSGGASPPRSGIASHGWGSGAVSDGGIISDGGVIDSMQNLAEMSKDTGWTPKRSEKEGFANASV